MKRIIALLLTACTFVACCAMPANAAKGLYGGAASYDIYFVDEDSTGKLWWKVEWNDKYEGDALYHSSFIVMLGNLSGTKYWGNYKNAAKTARTLTIGISKEITIGKAESVSVSGKLGFSVPVKAAKVSGEIGGEKVWSKTYQETYGTSSAYIIDTESKNGYYAVTHAANCDCYDVGMTKTDKNGKKTYHKGRLVRFSSANGYERLWYSKNAF